MRTGIGDDSWEADTGAIQRIRFADTSNTASTLALDNFRFQPVPEAGTSLLLMGSMLGLAIWRRRRPH